jgi:hypothetical protein
MSTVNGKDPKELTKQQALDYCYNNRDAFIKQEESVDEGIEQFDCLITILEGDTIQPHEITDYGMTDQDLTL